MCKTYIFQLQDLSILLIVKILNCSKVISIMVFLKKSFVLHFNYKLYNLQILLRQKSVLETTVKFKY